MASTEESIQIDQSKISEDDCRKFARWGLGRGINITTKTPWVEKTAFQVRHVKPENLIETDDGELLKAYSEEVRSRTTVKSEVQAGIKPTNIPVCVRMDVEHTRSTLSSKYVVGTKIKKRTISFRMDFADVPQSLVKNVEDAIKEAEERPSLNKLGKAGTWSKSMGNFDDKQNDKRPRLHAAQSTFHLGRYPEEPAAAATDGMVEPHIPSLESIADRPLSRSESVFDEVLTMPEGSTFEERLGFWIKNCLKRQGYHCPSSENFRDMIHSPHLESIRRPMVQVIKSFLDHFVREFGVTHYVSAIELGALEYKELTSKEYYNRAKLSSKASLSVAAYGGAEASSSHTFTKSKKSEKSERKKIGVMSKEKVAEEAVIGCAFTPISALIKMPFLQLALKSSVDKYVVEASKGGGPYHIMFGADIDTPKYIAVYREEGSGVLKLKGTLDIKGAELFTVKVLDDSDTHNRLEFSITSSLPEYRKKVREQKKIEENPWPVEEGQTTTGGTEEEADGEGGPRGKVPQASEGDNASMMGEGESGGCKSRTLEYYLETRVNTWGKGDVVRMRMNSRLKNVRLLLKQRINPKISCNTKQWRRGRESYYIQCIHNPRNGYLCVKTRGDEYQVCVRPSVDRHSDENGVFMLFQLKSSA